MVTKVVELVGSSSSNWTDAVNNAVHKANKTIDGITGVEVTNFTADIKNGIVTEYRADIHLAFGVHK